MPNIRAGRAVAVGLLLCALGACHRASPPANQQPEKPFLYQQRLGLANWRDGRGCLAAFNATIAPETNVALVHQPLYAEPPSVELAKVGERLPQACDVGLSMPNNAGVSPSFYAIHTADGTSPSGTVFVILDPVRPVSVRDGRVESDLDGDAAMESFRVCNSAENVHFMVWTGSPAQGTPRWRGTFYVGYDMDPNCSDQDIAGMVALDKGKF
jgi:hypothetical protein